MANIPCPWTQKGPSFKDLKNPLCTLTNSTGCPAILDPLCLTLFEKKGGGGKNFLWLQPLILVLTKSLMNF